MHTRFTQDIAAYVTSQHSFMLGHDQGSSLCLQRNTNQVSSVARYMHLCVHARMYDESHLAPHPGL